MHAYRQDLEKALHNVSLWRLQRLNYYEAQDLFMLILLPKQDEGAKTECLLPAQNPVLYDTK